MRTKLNSSRWAFALLASFLLLTPACNKKPSTDGGPSGDPAVPAAPEKISSDMLLFANVRAQDIMKTPFFEKLTKSKIPTPDKELSWADIEKMAEDEIGIKPSSLETLSVFLSEMPEGPNMPKMVVIVACNAAIKQETILAKMKSKKSSRAGFHEIGDGGLAHFPDAKTLVMLHPDLAQSYLDGYAKDRSGWPFNAELRKAAGEHTMVVSANLTKAPADFKQGAPREMRSLAEAKSVTVALDIKGTDLKLGVLGGYGSEGDARKAKESIDKFLTEAKTELRKTLDSPNFKKESEILRQFLTNALKAIDEAKVEVTGSDLKAAIAFNADLPIGEALIEAVGKVRNAAARANSMNNLKQIGLGMHNCNDTIGHLPGGIRDKNGKLLLSWRVEILPFIEANNLYNQFKLDEPWDSENNKKLIPLMPRTFANVANPPTKDGLTHYRMMFGKDVVFGNKDKMTIQGIPDGASNTILVFEATDPTIWTKPDEIAYDKKMPLPKLGSLNPKLFLALFGDGVVRGLPTTDEKLIRLMFEKADGQPINFP